MKDAGDVVQAGGQLNPDDAVPMYLDPRIVPFPGTAPVISVRGTAEIFAPLGPNAWLSRDLQIGPGRVVLLVGYGASAKSLAAQALALAHASGVPIWGRFAVTLGRVVHFDYEQTWRATARRYQRLAIGMGIEPAAIGDRLWVASPPEVNLTHPRAFDAYAKACDGATLAIVDALRGAAPGVDENDSAVRAHLDLLTRVGEQTGCTFLVIHHAGKPREGHADRRTVARGSSAIFDAAGCVFTITSRGKGEPRLVTQDKTPAEAEGLGVDDFLLAIEDVPNEADPDLPGVRVVWRPVDARASAVDGFDERLASEILDVIARNPGITKNGIEGSVNAKSDRIRKTLAALVEVKGRVRTQPDKNRSVRHWLVTQEG